MSARTNDDETADLLRIDRWLFCVRLYKTRSQASQAVSGGHVHLNGGRVKSSRAVTIGDRVVVTRDGAAREYEVVGIPARRGPASEARACCLETAASVERGVRLSAALRAAALSRPVSDGRPDKKERRQLRALARRQSDGSDFG
jgi:ribosome-associated heat shock protein Hsp15